MAIPHAKPGEVISVLAEGDAERRTTTLLKTANVEVVRLVMAAGKEIAEHRAPGEIIVQCLDGTIEFTALGASQSLTSGQMLYLPAAEPHRVKCIKDGSFLLTILLK